MNTKLSRAEFKTVVNNYMISCIDSSGYNKETPTDKDKVNFVIQCFQNEYVKHNSDAKRMNEVALFADWLQGLPSSFGIDFENYRILEIAKKWGILADNATEYRKDTIINNWWNFIAVKFFQLHRHLNRESKVNL